MRGELHGWTDRITENSFYLSRCAIVRSRLRISNVFAARDETLVLALHDRKFIVVNGEIMYRTAVGVRAEAKEIYVEKEKEERIKRTKSQGYVNFVSLQLQSRQNR